MKKFLTTSLILLFLSIILQSLVDPNLFNFQYWDTDTWVNVLHFWLTFLTTYYLFAFVVKKGHEQISSTTSSALIKILFIAFLLSFLWVVISDLAFYFIYYKINSLLETTFYEFDLPLTVAVLTIGSFYFYQKHFNLPIRSNSDQSKQSKIEVFSGQENRLLNTHDVALFYLSENVTWVKVFDGKIYYTNHTLQHLTEMLSSDNFFKLNRQTIVARKAIESYERLNYQKLRLKLNNDLNTDANLVVSKYNAPIFKKWLTNSA